MQKILPDHIIISERQSKVMGTWPQAISSMSLSVKTDASLLLDR